MDSDDRAIRHLKLSDLRLLDVVVRQGGMARAAAQLNLSQPAISKAIAALEDMLGVRLLDRTPKGVVPTIYGQALLRGGDVIFDELRQRVKEIEFLADPAAGEVRVGMNSAQALGIAPAIVDRLMKRYPRVTLHFIEADTTSLHRELRARNIDVVLGSLPTAFAEDDLDVHEICDEQLRIVAGLRSSWTHRRKVELRELVDEPWVLPPSNHILWPLIVDAFRSSGVEPPKASVVTVSAQLVINLLAIRPFLATLPGSLLRLNGKRLSLKVLPIDLRMQRRVISILTLKGRALSPVARVFIDCARAVVAALAD